ncbi:hypothetical protein DFH06DRAFT_1416476 [Mycena polygramma]|nr:hypothetical protein DFH06DRAFT_1416476 [Mycena polygramma]
MRSPRTAINPMRFAGLDFRSPQASRSPPSRPAARGAACGKCVLPPFETIALHAPSARSSACPAPQQGDTTCDRVSRRPAHAHDGVTDEIQALKRARRRGWTRKLAQTKLVGLFSALTSPFPPSPSLLALFSLLTLLPIPPLTHLPSVPAVIANWTGYQYRIRTTTHRRRLPQHPRRNALARGKCVPSAFRAIPRGHRVLSRPRLRVARRLRHRAFKPTGRTSSSGHVVAFVEGGSAPTGKAGYRECAYVNGGGEGGGLRDVQSHHNRPHTHTTAHAASDASVSPLTCGTSRTFRTPHGHQQHVNRSCPSTNTSTSVSRKDPRMEPALEACTEAEVEARVEAECLKNPELATVPPPLPHDRRLARGVQDESGVALLCLEAEFGGLLAKKDNIRIRIQPQHQPLTKTCKTIHASYPAWARGTRFSGARGF